MNNQIKIGEFAFVTKLAGFEHTKYFQYGATRALNDIPLILGNNIKDGKVNYKFDWYITKELSEKLPRSALNKKCILIPYVGSKLGEVGIFKNEFRCHLGSNVAKVELIDDRVDLKYLYYFLRSPQGQAQLFKYKQGSAQPNITMESIRDTEIPLIDKKIQINLTKLLSNVDEKIDLNNKKIIDLEEICRITYNYWFIQFNFPDRFGNPYRISGGKMIWNKKLGKEIPQGWGDAGLYDGITNIKADSGIDEFKGEKVYLATADIDDNNIINETVKITYHERPSRANCQVRENTIWFAKMKNTKKYIYAVSKDQRICSDYIISTGFAGVKVIAKDMFDYILEFIRSIDFEKTKDLLSNGATQQSINDNSIKRIYFVYPEKRILNEYAKLMKENNNIIVKLKEENHDLSLLKDFILPMIMNGQIKID